MKIDPPLAFLLSFCKNFLCLLASRFVSSPLLVAIILFPDLKVRTVHQSIVHTLKVTFCELVKRF